MRSGGETAPQLQRWKLPVKMVARVRCFFKLHDLCVTRFFADRLLSLS